MWSEIILLPLYWNYYLISLGTVSHWTPILSELTALGTVQYIPRNMHTVTALLCFVVVIHWLIFPYPSGLLHWHCGNLTIAPVPAKQPWWIWINTSCEFIMNDCITTTKQSTTKPCAYFLGYTVHIDRAGKHAPTSFDSTNCHTIITHLSLEHGSYAVVDDNLKSIFLNENIQMYMYMIYI